MRLYTTLCLLLGCAGSPATVETMTVMTNLLKQRVKMGGREALVAQAALTLALVVAAVTVVMGPTRFSSLVVTVVMLATAVMLGMVGLPLPLEALEVTEEMPVMVASLARMQAVKVAMAGTVVMVATLPSTTKTTPSQTVVKVVMEVMEVMVAALG